MSSKKKESHSAGKRSDFSVAMPKGFLAGTASCGLKKRGGEDLAIIFSERPAVAAAVFTQNLVAAAPVLISREHLRQRTHRAIIVNSGGANACTGEEGLNDARQTAALVAEYFNCDDREVLIASTGVIGVRLVMA
jgi:glutamate N-acetyltransferase/amino-acid N-acetyltransferase